MNTGLEYRAASSNASWAAAVKPTPIEQPGEHVEYRLLLPLEIDDEESQASRPMHDRFHGKGETALLCANALVPLRLAEEGSRRVKERFRLVAECPAECRAERREPAVEPLYGKSPYRVPPDLLPPEM